ncbi:TPA: hypothetical protein ACQT04_006172 [Pseudomonas aeruginosa]
MSVQSNTYVLVGVKLNYQEFKDRYLGDDEEGYYQYVDPYSDSSYKGIQHHDGLCVIFDGMSGEYVFIGRVLAKSIDEHGEGIQITECTVTAGLRAEVSDLLVKHFELAEPDVRIWAFTHYR